jgi:type IV pilus assembly protein PilY1
MPHIINIKVLGTKKWVAVFGGGQNYGKDCTTGDVVYVMDLEDDPGTIIKQIAIPDDPSNSIYNTVNTNLTVIQRDGTAKANYYGALVYVADLENKLWKIDLTEKAGSNLGRKIKLFEDVATDTNGRRNYQEIVPVLDSSQNIDVRSGIKESNILRLYYGTGDMDNLAERTPQVLNRLYGISDMTFTNFSLTWRTADDLTNMPAQYLIGTCFDSTAITSLFCPPLNNVGLSKNIGWYIDLPESRKTTGRKALYDKEQVYLVIERFAAGCLAACG